MTRFRNTLCLAAILPALVWPVVASAQHPATPDRTLTIAGARQILQEALRESEAIRNPAERGILAQLAGYQAEVGDLAGALLTAATIPHEAKRREALFLIALAQAKSGDAQGALNTVAALQDRYAKEQVLATIVRARALAGNVAGALQVASSVDSAALSMGLLGQITMVQLAGGGVPEVLTTLSLMPDEPAQDQIRMMVALKQAEAGDIAEASKTADAIQRESDREMTRTGIALLEVRLRAKVGDTASALETVTKVLETRDGRARTIALGLMILGQIEAGDFAGAMTTTSLIAQEHDADAARETIAVSQAKAGDVNGALQTLQSIREDHSRASTLQAIAGAQVKVGDLVGALKTIETSGLDHRRDEILAAVAATQAQTDPGLALEVAEAITNQMRKRDALWRIALARATRGDASAILALAGQAWAVQNPSPSGRVSALLRAAGELLKDPDSEMPEAHAFLLPFLLQ